MTAAVIHYTAAALHIALVLCAAAAVHLEPWAGGALPHCIPPMWAGTHPSSCDPSIVHLLCVRVVTSPPANLVCRCLIPQVPAIVMLTRCNERGVTKCHPYYPEQAEEVMEVAPYQIEVGIQGAKQPWLGSSGRSGHDSAVPAAHGTLIATSGSTASHSSKLHTPWLHMRVAPEGGAAAARHVQPSWLHPALC